METQDTTTGTPVVPPPQMPVGDTPKEEPIQEKKSGNRNKIILGGLIVLLILLGVGYFAYTAYFKNGGVVATVNGMAIYKSELELSIRTTEQNATLQGADITDATVRAQIESEALDALINTALLVTNAKRAGMSTDDEAVKTTYASLVEQFGGEEGLKAQMAAVQLTDEKLRENILVKQYLDRETDIDTATATPEEVTAFIKEIEANDIELPPLEEIQPQIEAEIVFRKQQGIVDAFLEKLKTEATIEIKN